MHPYYNRLTEIATKQPAIDKYDLYVQSGIKDKRAFLTELYQLISDGRMMLSGLTKFTGRECCPRVLWLSIFKKEKKEYLGVLFINYIPLKTLEVELNYTTKGPEQEDCLDFNLQITGYKIEEKYKNFIEKDNGLTLNFDKFDYNIWSLFLTTYNIPEPPSNFELDEDDCLPPF